MADVADPMTCAACGRELPPQRGRGRTRRYCDATCRSAARRERGSARATRGGDQPSAIGSSAIGVGGIGDSGIKPPLAAVATARERATAANAALQAAVDRARDAGHSWREIGDVLDTSRQAAFQRFGRPVDPRTGRPMVRYILPGAAERAVTLLMDIVEGRWEDARSDFGEKMRAGLDSRQLADGWAAVTGMVGAFERAGEPLAYPAPDGGTVVDIPLYFEAGERTGRVSLDRDGKVVGLFIRPLSAEHRPARGSTGPGDHRA